MHNRVLTVHVTEMYTIMHARTIKQAYHFQIAGQNMPWPWSYCHKIIRVQIIKTFPQKLPEERLAKVFRLLALYEGCFFLAVR